MRNESTILYELLSVIAPSLYPKIQPNILSLIVASTLAPKCSPTNGIVNVSSDVAPLNTASPIYSTLLDNVNSVIDEQFSKAYFSTLINESGRVVI